MMLIYKEAKDIIKKLGASDSDAKYFATIIVFLSQNRDRANYLGKETEITTKYIESVAQKFIKSRNLQSPSMPETAADNAVRILLEKFYDVKQENIEIAIEYHMKAMGSENIIGYLLELYIANTFESNGWIWCSGSFVKAIDFIKPDQEMTKWELLQVKNRDNSENSSSSAIRDGTKIKKWFRSFSKTGETNWEQFPDESLRAHLTEQGFLKFIVKHIEKIKKTNP